MSKCQCILFDSCGVWCVYVCRLRYRTYAVHCTVELFHSTTFQTTLTSRSVWSTFFCCSSFHICLPCAVACVQRSSNELLSLMTALHTWYKESPNRTHTRHAYSRQLSCLMPFFHSPTQEDCARLTLIRFSSVVRASTSATEPSVQLDLESGTVSGWTSHSQTCKATVSDSLTGNVFIWSMGPQCSVNPAPLTAV